LSSLFVDVLDVADQRLSDKIAGLALAGGVAQWDIASPSETEGPARVHGF
jgi:hypothetical protein